MGNTGQTPNDKELSSAGETVESLKRQLADAEARAAVATKELEAFSYSVSHDLRAPLRAVDGFSRILLEDFSTTLDGEAQKFLQYIITNTQQMGRLIDDLLAYSRLNTARMQKTELDVNDMVRAILLEIRAKHPQREVNVAVKDLPKVTADANLFRQALVQLIDNSFKFTRPEANASIEIFGARQDGEIIYTVKDNGPGFDMQYSGKLFQVFQRLVRSDEFEGNGIGLAMVQRIASRHNGRAWVESTPDAGTSAHLALPGDPTVGN